MNAKEIFEQRRLQEAGGEAAGGQSMGGPPPPSGASANTRPRPTLRRPPEGMPGDDEEAMMHRMRGMPGGMRGRPEEMSGPFTASDMSKLKDVLLLIVCQQAGNDYDGGIAQQLMAGKPLDPGQVQHILDEAGRVGNIPEPHVKVLQKAFAWVQNPGSPA